MLAAPTWTGPVTDHFDGEKFFNPGEPRERPGFRDFARWQLTRDAGPWGAYRDEPAGPPPPAEVAQGALRVTFVNHATTLLQLDGVNVLTDPIWSERASPFSFAGPRRVRPPGVRFEDLPRIDAVVLSHNHYDHLDLPTLKRIQQRWPEARLFVGLGNRALLEGQGLHRVEELDWWQARSLLGVEIQAAPARHFSNRGIGDADGTLWCAWVLSGRGGRAYFGGDTGYGAHFAEAAERLGPFRLAVLPIGAYRPEWFMSPVHTSPAQAIQAAKDLKAALAVPMHYGTFRLADDGETEPVERLREQLAADPAPFRVLGFGEGVDVP